MANWYAVYTSSRCEEKVAEGFLKRKWESYCPLSKTGRSWPGLKSSGTALFPCYVFVRLEKGLLTEVRKVEGVINLVYWLGEPVIVRDIEIEMLKRFLNVHKQVVLEKTTVKPMAMVQLTEVPPPMRHDDGGVVTLGAAGARLLLPSLGYVVASVPQLNTHYTLDHAQLHQQKQELLQ